LTGFGAAHEEQFAAVGGGDGDVEQLHGGEFLQDDARHQARGEASELLAERDRQAVGKKGDEQMRFDPLGFVVKNGPQTQVALERAERLLDVAELHVTTPDQCRIVGREIGP
jgi:hypothetical protein